MHEKEARNEASLEPSQTFMIEFFLRKPLRLLALTVKISEPL